MYRGRRLDDDHRAFGETVGQFLAREVAPNSTGWTGTGMSRDTWRLAGQYGLLGVAIAEQYGGAGIDDPLFALVLAQGCMRAGLTGFGLAIASHGTLAAGVIANFADETQCAAWLPGLAAGEIIASVGGLDVPVPASRSGSGLRLDGVAAGVVGATSAGLVVVLARADDEVLAVLVDPTADGATVGPADELLAAPGAGIADLHLAGVEVAADAVLADGAVAALRADDRLALAMLAHSGAAVALDITVAYVRDRTVFGRTLAGFENTQQALAEVAVRIAASEALLDAALAERIDGPLSASRAAAVALACTDAHLAAVDAGLQLHGGYGYMREYPISSAFADARYLRLCAVPDLAGHREIAESIGL